VVVYRADFVVTFMLSQSRTICTLLPSQKPTPRHHQKLPTQNTLISNSKSIGRITNSVASFCADNFPCFPVQPCKLNRVVRRANATLDMNCDSSFSGLTVLQPAQKNPTSQPTQDVRNFQIVKEQKTFKRKLFLFFSRHFQKQRIKP
jgi:hypothetical protein